MPARTAGLTAEKISLCFTGDKIVIFTLIHPGSVAVTAGELAEIMIGYKPSIVLLIYF